MMPPNVSENKNNSTFKLVKEKENKGQKWNYEIVTKRTIYG